MTISITKLSEDISGTLAKPYIRKPGLEKAKTKMGI